MELIPPKITLLYKKSEMMESTVDYIRVMSFRVAFSRNIFNAPLEITEDAVLNNIRLSKKGGVKFKVIM